MMRKRVFESLVLIAFLGVTACGGETEPAPAPSDAGAGQMAPGQEMDPQMMALMMEVQELQQELAPIQQEAMQDEALSSQLATLQAQIEATMREEAPDLFERMEELEADFIAAQEAGDQERVQAVGMEAQEIEMDLQSLQQSVLDRPEVREPIDAFEEAQRARMMEIDPEAGALIDRIDEIYAELGMS